MRNPVSAGANHNFEIMLEIEIKMWDEDQSRSCYNARLGHHASLLTDICPVGEDRKTLYEKKKWKRLITLFVRSVGPSCILGHNQWGTVSLTSDKTIGLRSARRVRKTLT